MKQALVHDWFTVNAGAEKCVRSFVNILPKSDIFSLIDFLSNIDRDRVLNGKRVHTSFLQRLPFIKNNYRNFLPLFSFAIEKFKLKEYDLILSSSHCVAKGVTKHKNQLHICYMHTPVRYAWDLQEQYLLDSGLDKGIKGFLAKYFLNRLRKWDISTVDRVDHYIANSHYIAERIKRIYDRDATVIYPPVNIEAFSLVKKKEDFYLTASRLVSYKKIDLIVKAFSMTDKKLIVIGDGPEFKSINDMATANIFLMGYQEDDVLIDHMQRAKAFVFAAEEDFGIIPVEAQACGTPVICLGKGGTKETVVDLVTGVHFQQQNIDSLLLALNRFEENYSSFNPSKIREHSLKFSKSRFEHEMLEFINKKYAAFNNK